VRVCAITVEPETISRLKQRWEEWGLEDVPLDIVESPFREIGIPLISYLHQRDLQNPHHEPTLVVLPEFVVAHWWERLLHNQTSAAIRDALYHDQISGGRGRPVISVPYRIGEEPYVPMILQHDDDDPVDELRVEKM